MFGSVAEAAARSYAHADPPTARYRQGVEKRGENTTQRKTGIQVEETTTPCEKRVTREYRQCYHRHPREVVKGRRGVSRHRPRDTQLNRKERKRTQN